LRALLLLLLVPLASACVSVSLLPAHGRVAVEVSSSCDGVAKIIVTVKNATITSVSGFTSTAGNSLVWEGEVRKGENTTLSFAIVPTYESYAVSYEAYFNGLFEGSGAIRLGRGGCLSLKAGVEPLWAYLRGFEVPRGGVLGIAVSNLCDNFIKVPVTAKFLYGTPSSVAVGYCERPRTEVFLVLKCAEYKGEPVKECVKWSQQGPFRTIFVAKELLEPKCEGCKLIKEKPGLRVYSCSKCEGPLERTVKLEAREPVCLEARCARWTVKPVKVKYCELKRYFLIKSNASVAGRVVGTTLNLPPRSSALVTVPFSEVPSAFYLGSVSPKVKVPLATVSAGGLSVTVYEAVPNGAYALTVLLYALSIIAFALALWHLLG